jgi:hypothetical protein
MNPSRPFILRPIATSLLMAAILLIGIIGFRQLPIAALPEVDYPTMQVMTFYPGASADVVATAITAPLERQLGEVPGLSQMLSSSSAGASVITLQFNLSLNIDVAEQDVQEAINAAQNYLPAQLPMPPVYNKVNPADAPILTLALTSDSMPLSQVEDYTDTRLAAENLAAPRRRRGDHQRRPKTRRARPDQSDPARLLRPESGGRAHRAHRHQPGHRQGQLRRPGAKLSNRRQRSDHDQRGFQARWSSPTATAPRSCSRMWRRSSTAWRTPSSRPG